MARVERWERRTDAPLILLALAFLVVLRRLKPVDGRYGGSEKPSLVFKPDSGRCQAPQRGQNDQEPA